jgi:hypothetical protein
VHKESLCILIGDIVELKLKSGIALGCGIALEAQCSNEPTVSLDIVCCKAACSWAWLCLAETEISRLSLHLAAYFEKSQGICPVIASGQLTQISLMVEEDSDQRDG